MNKALITKSQQQTPAPSIASGGKATKGYAAVTQFMQPPAAKHTAGNALPKPLKSGIEGFSGLAMDDVQVHYNSPEPARIGALASAEGNRINLGPGQEKHLPHEAWHVVQQKQGRVKPTLQAKGLAINDDQSLETEADVMGQRTAQLKTTDGTWAAPPNNHVFQSKGVTQRKIGFEFQAYDSIIFEGLKDIKQTARLGTDKEKLFDVIADGGANNLPELEFKTTPVDETDRGRVELVRIITKIKKFVDEIDDGDDVMTIDTVDWNPLYEVSPFMQVIMEIFEQAEEDTSDDDEHEGNEEEEEDDDDDDDEGGDLSSSRQTTKEEQRILSELRQDETPARDTTAHAEPGVERLAGVEVGEAPVREIFRIRGSKHFHPQATIGIKFEKIAQLIDYLTQATFKTFVTDKKTAEIKTGGETAGGVPEAKAEAKRTATAEIDRSDPLALANLFGWSGKEDQKAFKQAWTLAQRNARSEIKSGSEKVISFATILYGFVQNITSEVKPADGGYFKYWMPFMLRNGLVPFYNSLSLDEKKELDNLKDLNKRVIPDGLINEENLIKTDSYKTVTIEVLLTGLKANMDLFQKTVVSGYGKINSGNYGSWGDMKSVDDIGESDIEKRPEKIRQGAIIELRKLGNDVPPGKLEEFALAVFDLVRLLNFPGTTSSTSSSSSSSSSTPLPPPVPPATA
jgi:hypothetical protein